MHLYAIYNFRFNKLLSLFISSIQDELDVTLFHTDITPKQFMDEDYRKLIDFKVQKCLETIKENKGKYIIWSDIDIVFLKPVLSKINFALDTDLIAVPEFDPNGDDSNNGIRRANWINAGFLILHCNDKIIALYEELLIRLTINQNKRFYEQDLLNELIIERKIRVEKLTNDFWLMHKKKPSSISMAHATSRHGDDKYNELAYVFNNRKKYITKIF